MTLRRQLPPIPPVNVPQPPAIVEAMYLDAITGTWKVWSYAEHANVGTCRAKTTTIVNRVIGWHPTTSKPWRYSRDKGIVESIFPIRSHYMQSNHPWEAFMVRVSDWEPLKKEYVTKDLFIFYP